MLKRPEVVMGLHSIDLSIVQFCTALFQQQAQVLSTVIWLDRKKDPTNGMR
jgi:hypothetical protein